MSLLVEYLQAFKHFQRDARLFLISNMLSGVTVGIILVLYNLYLIALGYDTSFVGQLLFVTTLGAGCAIFPAGLCVDRFSGKWIMILGSLAIGIAGAGQFLLHQPLPLLISGFAAGVGGAFILVVNAPFLTHHSTPRERPHLFSVNIVLLQVTTVIGELLGGALPQWIQHYSWLTAWLPSWAESMLAPGAEARAYQLSLLFAGIIAAPSFIPLLLMRDAPPPRPPQQDRATHRPAQRPGLHWRPQALLRSPLTILIAIQVLIGLGAGLFIPYFNIYFVHTLGASPFLFGVIDGGANIVYALLTLLAPLLATALGKINTIVLTRLISLPLLLAIGLIHYLPLVSILYLFRLGTMDMGNGLFQVFSMEAIERKNRGMANSLYQIAYQGASAISTPIGGLFIDQSGYSVVFIGAAILYLCSLLLLWGYFGRGKGERLVTAIRLQEPSHTPQVEQEMQPS